MLCAGRPAVDPGQVESVGMGEATRAMSGEIRLPRQRKIARLAFVGVALVALFVTLVRPVCDAHGWQIGVPQSGSVVAAVQATGDVAQHGHTWTCCNSMHDAWLAVPATTVADAFKSPPAAALTASSTPGWRVASASLAVPIPPDGLPRLRPFYARSARILS